jgi:hypothetical protein
MPSAAARQVAAPPSAGGGYSESLLYVPDCFLVRSPRCRRRHHNHHYHHHHHHHPPPPTTTTTTGVLARPAARRSVGRARRMSAAAPRTPVVVVVVVGTPVAAAAAAAGLRTPAWRVPCAGAAALRGTPCARASLCLSLRLVCLPLHSCLPLPAFTSGKPPRMRGAAAHWCSSYLAPLQWPTSLVLPLWRLRPHPLPH